ncbi:MAG: DUF4276 family protein [Planctomycetota bacterium]
MGVSVVSIVEGHSEQQSVPVLLRRLQARLGTYQVRIARPFRVKRNRVVREGELERAVTQALRSRENTGALLLLLDADDDCPVRLGQSLLARCRACTGLPVAVVLANREFEAWFLGAKDSLRGVRAVRPDAQAPTDPETIRGAKERLSANMAGRRYLEVDDQPALATKMDIDLAVRRCRSFAKFVRDTAGLLSHLDDSR